MITVFILRVELAQLISRLRTIKHKGTEFDFSQGVSDARHKAEQSLPSPSADNSQALHTSERLAELSPRGAVLESWLEVESALGEMAKRYGISPAESHPGDLELLRVQLSDYEPLGRGAFELLEKLRKLRNEAVHLREKEIDPVTAVQYANLANRVIKVINEA